MSAPTPTEALSPAVSAPLSQPADDIASPANANATPNTHGAQPPSKKRRTATTSRGVANLTPEQLARKRANDREAQRAIRERTKTQIDRLHARIHELENQQPYHDLQLVLRDKEAVQAENADIRKRLESVMALLQPIIRAPAGLNELAAAAQERLPPPLPRRDTEPPPSTVHLHSHSHPHTSNHANHAPHLQVTLHDIAAHSPSDTHSPATVDTPRQWIYPTDAHPHAQAHAHPPSHLRRYPPDPPMPFDERLGVDFLLESNTQRRPVDPDLPPPHQPQPSNVCSTGLGQYAPNLVPHLTLPRNIPGTCPLDVILLDFLQDRQVRAADGVPIKSLVGPSYPNFTSLVYPDRCVESHPLSKLFTDILRTFPDICGVPEQVAIVFIMFLVMRWQIEPTQENYDRLPHWVTPRASQLFTAHPCWFDHLPWPRLRDRLIGSQPFISFDAFFIPFTTTVSLNWPYEARDCLLPASKIHAASLSAGSSIHASSPYSTHMNAGSPQDPHTPQAGTPGAHSTHSLPKDDDQWLINPAFESHLRDLNNWSLGPSFRGTFPAWADAVKIKEGR